MHWLMALLGAFFGALVGGGGSVFLGLVFGVMLGWQWGRLQALRQRLDAMESRLRTEAAIRAAQDAAKRAGTDTSLASGQGSGAAGDAARFVVEPAVAKERVAVPPQAMDEEGRSKPPEVASTVAREAPLPDKAAPVATTPQRPIAPAPAAWPREPVPPNLFERAFERVRAWLFTGNVPVKIGILVLLFGVAAALKYSVEAGWVSVSLPARLAMIAAGGLLLWSAAALALYPFAAPHLWAVMIVVVLIGGGGGLGSVLQTRLMDVAGDAQTLAAALNHSAFNTANAIGPLLAGMAVAAGWGWTSTGWVGVALSLGGFAVWAVAWTTGRKTPQSDA